MKDFSEIKNLKNKRVLLRLDLNESVDKQGKLLDDFRLQSSLPTIRSLLENGKKIIIVSHVGRPEGTIKSELSLKPMAMALSEMLDYKFVVSENELPQYPIPHVVLFTGDIRLQEIRAVLNADDSNNIIVLENIRFYSEEESQDENFAKQLAELAELYVNDAFGVVHRSSASVTTITKFLPSYPGMLLSKEIAALNILLSPRVKKPFVLLMGGIKIADKSDTLMNLGKRADQILIGGGLANLFLDSKGYNVGDHQIDVESKSLAKQILMNFGDKVVLPSDAVVQTGAGSNRGQVSVKKLLGLSQSDTIYDIGPATILDFAEKLQLANTICWNGPLGYFEDKKFRAGTMSLAKVLGGMGKRKAYVLAGGGETVAAIKQSGQLEHFDHVSTGGGAMLEYLAGTKLPGIEALD